MARYAPIAQAIVHGPAAAVFFLKPFGDCVKCLIVIEAVILP